MARHLVESELSRMPRSSVQFRLATAGDDLAIRRLLRENPMPGAISLSFEREPNYFRGMQMGGTHDQTILAVEKDSLVCMGRCSVRDRFINGRVRRVGYLGELRLDKSAEGRFDILRRGYRFFQQLHEQSPADIYFTSIAGDNARSIRFLERHLPGMPAYTFLSEFVTLVIPVPHTRRALLALENRRRKAFAARNLDLREGNPSTFGEIAELLDGCLSRYQLTSSWSIEELFLLADAGLAARDWTLVRHENRLIGCFALWDQRCFKQIVIRGFDWKLKRLRPFVRLMSRIFDMPEIPDVGSVLSQAFVSPLGLQAEFKDILPHLISNALAKARQKSIDFVTAGFGADDPSVEVIRTNFRCREYRTRLYQVTWEGSNDEHLVRGPFSPEVALL